MSGTGCQVSRPGCGCGATHGRRRRQCAGTRLTVDFSAMADQVNCDQPVFPVCFVDDPIIADSQFSKSRERSCERLYFYCFEVLRQPTELIDDSLRNRLIESLEVTDGLGEEFELEHLPIQT